MFKTVKSKILLMIIIMLAVLMVAFIWYFQIFGVRTKQLMLQNYSFSINSFAQQINEKVIRTEDNSRDLALIGSLFYKTDRSISITNKAIMSIFENYPDSLGGGIWFEPYVVDKNQKRMCFYAFRNKNNELVLDENFSSDEYDYHNQGWYKQITSQITKEHNTAWSLPYYENQGSETMMITVGTGIFDGDKLIGLSTVDWEINSILNEISEMKPIENGFYFFEKKEKIKDSFSLFANKTYNYIIVLNDPYLDNNALVGKTLDNVPWYNENLKDITYFDYHGKKYVPFVKYINNGMILITCVSKTEMYKDLYKFMFNMALLLLIFGFAIPSLLYLSLNKNIINPIDKLTKIAEKISKGEEIEIKIEKPEEFEKLAKTFDNMTKDIKTVTKEREKINSELSIAQSIQLSSLPNVFPPFPEKKEFDIYASMEPAKEVGGDFYDFYFTEEKDNFMFLIADVSGKGVPAALFMMTVKTLINNMAQIGYSPKELINIINNKICENNKQGFFVTMLAGIINIKTGHLSLINCGHNIPLIKHASGQYDYINLDSNIPLGIFEKFDFSIYETQLQKDDVIFIYTDGITEAINVNHEMYGEQKLKDSLNSIDDKKSIKEIISEMKQNIKNYTSGITQSDDITMLCFKYYGAESNNLKEFKEKAVIENYKPFCNWLHSILNEWNVNKELFNEIDMCAEEIYANITFYAYPEKNGDIKVFADNQDNKITLIFEDSGIPYNPLEKPDPDITLPPEKRPLGGLGIFMVKKMTENVIYKREDNKNILTLVFNN